MQVISMNDEDAERLSARVHRAAQRRNVASVAAAAGCEPADVAQEVLLRALTLRNALITGRAGVSEQCITLTTTRWQALSQLRAAQREQDKVERASHLERPFFDDPESSVESARRNRQLEAAVASAMTTASAFEVDALNAWLHDEGSLSGIARAYGVSASTATRACQRMTERIRKALSALERASAARAVHDQKIDQKIDRKIDLIIEPTIDLVAEHKEREGVATAPQHTSAARPRVKRARRAKVSKPNVSRPASIAPNAARTARRDDEERPSAPVARAPNHIDSLPPARPRARGRR